MNRPLFYIVFLLISQCVFSQNRQYVFNHVSVKNGLASDHVYSMLQDKKGFMWFGTANGLQRYDGRKIISFRPHPTDTAFLPADPISQMILDKNNRFWIRLSKEVGIFNQATFTYTRVPADVPRQALERSDLALWEDNEGNIFLSLSQYGMLVYKEQSKSFVRDSTVIDSRPDAFISSFQQDPADGNYWIGTTKGLSLFHRRNRKVYTPESNAINHPILNTPIAKHAVVRFFIDRQSRLWIGSWIVPQNKGLMSVYDISRQKLTTPVSFGRITSKYHELYAIRQLSNNSIWMHGMGMLAEYSDASARFNQLYNAQPDDYGIRYDAVHSFYEDREQNIWLGTDRGVYIFNPAAQKFTSIGLMNPDEQLDLENKSLTSFVQLSSGDVWCGSWGKGIFSYDQDFRAKPNNIIQPGTPPDNNFYMVWSFREHTLTKKVWVGCQAGRLMVHDPATGKTIHLNHPVFEQRTIRTISEDQEGNLWFGTQHGRLIKWDRAKGAKRLEDGFELVHAFNSHIFVVKHDKEGLLWIGTFLEGMVVMNAAGAIITNYHDKAEPGRALYRNMVTDILFYDDTLVIAGATALNFVNRKTGAVRLITTEEGLPGNSVSTLQRDDEGNLWIGLINGLCRYNMKKKIFTLFSQRDGIVRNEFHDGRSYRLRDGRMIFGNPHDFVFFNPSQILSSSAPPDVSITDFKLFNTYLPPDSILQLDRVELDHNQNSIAIEFAALSFLQKDKMVYYTKMEGIEDDWTRVSLYNIANFTLLPPGDYTFKVRCENGDGIPSKHITSLRIHIRPPFWRQEWFIMICILALGALIYLAHRIRVRQLMQMEKVRGRIARDLHDDMGSTLSTINILSEMAKMKVNKDTEKTSEYISKISDNSNRMMEAMDDIVWSINPMNDSMQRITARMREFATGVLEAKDIEVVFRVDEKVKDLRLGMESRRDFFLIFKEAVNNIAKYSRGKHASIDISVEGSSWLVMVIKDDGVGFDVENADSGNGLTNMQKRAESIKGSLVIESVPGVGTQVRLRAPLL